MRILRIAAFTMLASGLVAGCGTMQGMNPFSSGDEGKAPATPSYVVFFPGTSTMLSAGAKQIIASAAAASKSSGGEAISVSGPSTKIAPGYDPRYAQARVDSVIRELIADGVRQDRIAQGSMLTDAINTDASGAQRVELHLIQP